jgi:hypothetical protein
MARAACRERRGRAMTQIDARDRNTDPLTINIAECHGWVVATDRVQWILRRRRGTDKLTGANVWRDVSFVHTTLHILERCMREKGAPLHRHSTSAQILD